MKTSSNNKRGNLAKSRHAKGSPKALFDKALALHENGDHETAQNLCAKILKTVPSHVGALHLSGVLAAQSGDSRKAVAFMQKALDITPDYPEALYDLGTALLTLGRKDEARLLFEQAAALAGDFQEPLHALGLIALENGEPEESEKLFRKALSIAPDDPDILLHLVWALRDQELPEEAAEVVSRSLALRPGLTEARLELAELLMERGEPEKAETVLREGLALDPDSPHLWFQRGKARIASALPGEKPDVARECFEKCLKLAPADPFGAHAELALLGFAPVPERASEERIRNMYDAKARIWDRTTNGEVRYRGAELIGAALEKSLGHRQGLDVVDVGCGSGLCGAILRPLARRLDGVDLSQAMLDLAKEKGLYDRLAQADLALFLSRAPNSFDLVVAAAALIYFGELAPVMRAAYAALRPGGVFVFTVFPRDGEGFDLTNKVYYVHGRRHVLDRAKDAGFTLISSEDGAHEYQDGRTVTGWAVALKKPENEPSA